MGNFGMPPPQQRRARMSGCAVAVLIVTAIVCCVGGACVLCVAIGGHETKAERVRSEKAWAAHTADLNAKARIACDAGPTDKIEGIDDVDLQRQCYKALQEKAFPDRLDLPEIGEPGVKFDSLDGCSRRLRISIMRPASSSAKHKIQTGICIYDPRTAQTHYSFEPP